MQRILFWSLVGLTLAVYAAMLGWSLPAVSSAAGGLTPFDMRPSGYTHAEAAAFLGALTPEGAAFYRGVQQRLDIFYPALIALTLGLSIVALLPRRWGGWRWLAGLLALPIAVCDYLENHAVARMIEGGAGLLTPQLAAEASQWTVLKSTATTVAMSALLVLLLVRGAVALRRVWPRLRAFVARHAVATFLVVALGLSALVQYAAVASGLSLFAASALGTGLGLALPAVAVTALAEGRPGVGRLLSRAFRVSTRLRWYLLAAFGLLVATIVGAATLRGFAPFTAFAGDLPGLVTGFLSEVLLGLVLIQFCEELAWTGFLHERIRQGRGLIATALLVAPAFAASHLMLNWLGSGDAVQALVMLGVQVVFAVFFRIVVGWLYEGAGGSVVIAALFHAAFNAMNGAYAGGIVGADLAGWLPLALVAIAAVAIAARRLVTAAGGPTGATIVQ